MAQLIRITSEALQATIRRLLPSQQGFGEDLQASNVITPIIDLTPTAEGSQLPVSYQQALSFADGSEFSVTNTTDGVANTPGFYRIIGSCTLQTNASAQKADIYVQNGVTLKQLFAVESAANTDTQGFSETFDFVVFLDTSDVLRVRTNSTASIISGSVRQVADRYGNLTNPTGFSFE
jgi:hypothetical protein